MMILTKLVLLGIGTAIAKRWRGRRASAGADPAEPLDEGGSSAECARLGASLDSDEAEIDNSLVVSGAGLALAAAGAVGSPALVLASLPPLAISLGASALHGYDLVVEERRIAVATVDMLAMAGPFFTGHLVLTGLALSLFHGSRKLLLRTKARSRDLLVDVAGAIPVDVWVLRDGVEVQAPLDSVVEGELIVVEAGGIVPVDGVVHGGRASIVESALTGEGRPVVKDVGAALLASTLVVEGRVVVRAERTGVGTVAAQIGQILDRTVDFTTAAQTRGEAIVESGARPTLGISAVGLLTMGPTAAWALTWSGFGYHMRFTAPLLVINFLQRAADSGVLVKDGRALEHLGQVDTVVFDKTGTLTEDVFDVRGIHTVGAFDEVSLLRFAAGAEARQSHPIAEAIRRAAASRGLDTPRARDVASQVGRGIRAEIDGLRVCLGNPRLMREEGVSMPDEAVWPPGADSRVTRIYLAVDGAVAGVIDLEPRIRPEAVGVVRALKAAGLELYVLSGDRRGPTERLAERLGIDHAIAEVLPADKARVIEDLRARGRAVCFVGDGINDSIGLKTADVSISLSGATTVATDAASIVLLDGSLRQLPSMFALAREMSDSFRASAALTIAPGVANVIGVFALGTGFYTAVALYYAGIAASGANAILPRLRGRSGGRIAAPGEPAPG